MSENDKNRGLYGKYYVDRVDGQHKGREYYVLDLEVDKHAVAALNAYATSCEADYPLLAKDLRRKAVELTTKIAERGINLLAPDLSPKESY